MISYLNQLFDHLYWADQQLFEALPESLNSSETYYREFAHVIGAEEIWHARIEHRIATCEVWPDIEPVSMKKLMQETHKRYKMLMHSADEEILNGSIEYVNSAGDSFSNKLSDILVHVCLHGQYHRGKVNLLLREEGLEPAPVDFIAFVRGAPAATRNASD